MDYKTPCFTKEMIASYTILLPNMAVTQFRLVSAAFAAEGYHVEVLDNRGSEVAQLGLKYVHNDTCYPALLVIGQFLDALQSGRYDLHHTALAITQTGGGCRASNYIKLLRKALVRAGYGYIPVASINFSNLEKESSLPLTVHFGLKALAAAYYGDLLDLVRNQIRPYEINAGETDAVREKWMQTISGWMKQNKNYLAPAMKRRFRDIVQDFSMIPVHRTVKPKVGIVGEIYVKFSPLGNNDLQKFLEAQGCEVNLPTLMGFAEYCLANQIFDQKIYGGKRLMAWLSQLGLRFLDSLNHAMAASLQAAGFRAPCEFRQLMTKTKNILSVGVKMGEGWLLPAEMAELIESGYENIVCAQPFGCLPNHIAGKGVIRRIRECYPQANITPIDYDPSATRVNQENRIKLMLAVARERLQSTAG